MVISQSGYAAELIDRDGNTFKFDDIGCMVRFTREGNRKDTVAKYYVMDYNDKRWIQAEQATYVKAEQTASPMASGLTAFQDPSRAKEYTARNKGQILHFDDLWKGDVAEPPRHGMDAR